MKNINQKQWRELIANDKTAIIIDVRRPDEWQQGIIENAIMINVLDTEIFEKQALTLVKEKNYYLYCRSGKRSVSACQLLEKVGIKSTFNLLGGMLAWEGATVVP